MNRPKNAADTLYPWAGDCVDAIPPFPAVSGVVTTEDVMVFMMKRAMVSFVGMEKFS